MSVGDVFGAVAHDRFAPGAVHRYFADLGVALPDRAGNVAVRCFADQAAHKNGDRSSSASVNTETGAWMCHGCDARGGPYDAALALGRSPSDAMQLLERHGLVDGNGRRDDDTAKLRLPAGAQNGKGCSLAPGGERQAVTLPTDDEMATAQQRLLRDENLMARLWEIKGFSIDAVRQLGLGWETRELAQRLGFQFDGGRLLFAIRSEDGRPYALTRYLPGDRRNGKRKVLAHGSRGLFPAPESVSRGQRDRPLYLVEGESKVPALVTLGLPVVGFPGTETKKTVNEWACRFAGHESVVVVADCDNQGRAAVTPIAEALAAHVPDVRRLDIDESRSDGFDIGDVLRDGVEGIDQEEAEPRLAAVRRMVEDMAARAPKVKPPDPSIIRDAGGAVWRRHDVHRMLSTEPPTIEWLIDRIAAKGYLSMLVGREKEGKSLVSLGFGAACASGGQVVAGVECRPARVLYVDAENGERTMHARLRLLGLDAEHAGNLAYYEVRAFDLRKSLRGLRDRIAETHAELVILDSFRTLWGGDENSSDDVTTVLKPVVETVHELDIAVVLIHHMNRRSGDYRGNSAIGASVEHIVELARETNDEDRTRRVLRNPASRFEQEAEDRWVRVEVDRALGCLFLDAAEPPEREEDDDEPPARAPVRRQLSEEIDGLMADGRRRSLAEIAAGVGRPPKDGSVRRCLKALVAAGRCIRHPDLAYEQVGARCHGATPLGGLAPGTLAPPDKHGDFEFAAQNGHEADESDDTVLLGRAERLEREQPEQSRPIGLAGGAGGHENGSGPADGRCQCERSLPRPASDGEIRCARCELLATWGPVS